MDESFPGAENAFRDAFDMPDPIPKLRELIHAHPDDLTIIDLVVIYMEAVEKAPTQADKLAGALVNLKNSKEVIFHHCPLGNRTEIPIADSLRLELHDLLRSDLNGPRDAAVTPSNEYLITSLLCATSIKYGLSDSPAFPYAVARGCIIKTKPLSISGSHLRGPYLGIDDDNVLSALEGIREAGVLKDPNGQRLLEVTIQQAKDGFNSDVDGWNILFPQ